MHITGHQSTVYPSAKSGNENTCKCITYLGISWGTYSAHALLLYLDLLSQGKTNKFITNVLTQSVARFITSTFFV